MKKITLFLIFALFFFYIMLLTDAVGLPFNGLLFLLLMILIFITSIILMIKKKIKLVLALLLSVVLMTIFAYVIGLQIPPQFRKFLYKHSLTINESKNDNAFICEYKLLTDSAHNKYGIFPNEVFLEYEHQYKSWNSRLFVIDKECKWLTLSIKNIEELWNNDTVANGELEIVPILSH